MNFFTPLLAAGAAAALAYPFNRYVQAHWGSGAMLSAAALWEEAGKTIAAVFLSAPLLPVHVLFGVYEAVVDSAGGVRHSGRDAMLSIFSHMIFGAAACAGRLALAGATGEAVGVWAAATTAPQASAAVAACVAGAGIHLLWNRCVWLGIRKRSVDR